MTPDQLIAAGGTASTIAILLFVANKFGSGAWLPRETVHERIAERDAAHAREIALVVGERDRAIATAEVLVPAVEKLTEELESARAKRRGER
jgi:hypothetical protein